MRSRQRGATLIGMLTIVSILGFAAYGGIRLFPLYMEYLAVVRAMEQTAKEQSGGTPQTMRVALDRRWAIEDIKTIDPKDIEIKRVGKGGFIMRAWYRAEAPFVANVSLVAEFDKSVPVAGR